MALHLSRLPWHVWASQSSFVILLQGCLKSIGQRSALRRIQHSYLNSSCWCLQQAHKAFWGQHTLHPTQFKDGALLFLFVHILQSRWYFKNIHGTLSRRRCRILMKTTSEWADVRICGQTYSDSEQKCTLEYVIAHTFFFFLLAPSRSDHTPRLLVSCAMCHGPHTQMAAFAQPHKCLLPCTWKIFSPEPLKIL